ncbi:MAG: alpha/beta fold hydrolase [Proteobacteria bacterium]|nr:alpha/beta fold hydrolase [Pseudomonadota bacterium]
MPVVPTADGALHYDAIDITAPWMGKGLPILFHHGIGSSALLWRGWFPALIDRYPVVAFDMRGCGRSSRPPADFKWSLEGMIDDLFAVADAAGFERFHVVGESLGGTVALAAAIMRPDRVATLTVSNGAHLGASIQRVEVWRGQLDDGGTAGWSHAFMPDRFQPGTLDAGREAWFEAQQAEWPRDSILKALGVLIGTDLTPRLAEIRCPTLVLHPDSSPFIPVPVVAELHRLLPDARLNIIGPARHGLPFSHAAQCTGLLRSFLDTRATD